MKISKIIFSITAFASVFSAYAFDFGGLLTNTTKFSGNEVSDMKLNQKNSASVWMRQPLSSDGESFIAVQGTYQFEHKSTETQAANKLYSLYNITKIETKTETKNTSTIDLDLLQLMLKKELSAGKFTFSLGRFYNSDLTRTVFSQNADGMLVGLSGNTVEFSLYGAYTGLLNGNVVSMLSSPAKPHTADPDVLYDLAEKYVIGAATVSFPNLLANQTLQIQAFDASRVEKEGYNRIFGTLALNGPIVSTIYYNLSSTMEFMNYNGDGWDAANLTKASISYFSDFKAASLSLNGVYASGKNGKLRPFRAFTSSTAYNALNDPEYEGIIKSGISGTVKPAETLLISASGDLITDVSGNSSSYKGIQYNVGADWQVVSDFMVGVNFYQYFDNDNSTKYNKNCLQIRAVLTF